MEKQYQTTKEECQQRIDSTTHNSCTRCGNKIHPIETVNNSGNPTFWSGCSDCGFFDGGTTNEIYQISQRMVNERSFRAYSHMKREDYDLDYWTKSQISGTVSIVRDILQFKDEIKNN